MSSGKWQDFATGEHGDSVDLFAKIYSVAPAEAAKSVARCVGHEHGASA